MSERRKTVTPTRVFSRSSQRGRSELIAREKYEKQSAKKRTALDNRFHRTDLRFSGTARTRHRNVPATRTKRAVSAASAS
jgi:hypothetical protein